jgi:glycerophosphoryl diester phosphodiesterase
VEEERGLPRKNQAFVIRRPIVAVLALALLGAGAPAHAAEDPLVMAHRGGARLWPENTMLAFQNATDLGVDMLELDVKITKDGVPVVIHDPTLDRTTNCTGMVAEQRYPAIDQCDAAYWFRAGGTYPYRGTGVTIPRLAQVLRFAREQGVRVLAEIKNIPTDADFEVNPAVYVDPVVAAIKKTGTRRLVMLSSFWPFNLDLAALALPDVPMALLTLPEFPCASAVAFATLRGYEAVQPGFTTVDLASCVPLAHAVGLEVHPWTVDSTKEMRRLIGLGVDGIITNRPDVLLGLVS